MKSEWKTIRADEFCSLVTDGTHDSPKPQAAGRKLITSKHLKGYYLDFESANWISSEDYEKVIARSSVEQWDILYSMIGTIGNVYLEKNPVVDYACKNVGIFKFGGNCNKAYWMYYYLKSPQAMEFIKAHLRGTTQLYVPLATLREMPVPVPDEEERNKIVAILRTLDDKIQCSIKINDNLEQQAQAIFKEWFIENPENNEWSTGTFSELIKTTLNGDWGKEAPTGNNTEKVYCIRGADIPEVKAGNKGKMPTRYILPKTSVYKGYKQDKIEMRGDRAEMSDFPLYLNTVAGGLDRRDQTIGGFSFVVKIYAVPVVEIIGQLLYLLGRYGFNAQFSDCL